MGRAYESGVLANLSLLKGRERDSSSRDGSRDSAHAPNVTLCSKLQ